MHCWPRCRDSRDTSSPPRCADASTAPKTPANGCKPSAWPTWTSLSQPGLFRTAFTSHPATSDADGHDLPDGPESRSPTESADPYEILGHVLDEAQDAGLLHPNRRPGAEIAAWSAIHGLASLLLDGPLPTTAAGIQFALSQVMELIERALLNGRQKLESSSRPVDN